MSLFIIHYQQLEYRTCYIEAPNESAARQAFIDGDRDEDELDSVEDSTIMSIEEDT